MRPRRSVWIEEGADGRYLVRIKGLLFTRTLPYAPNALIRSGRIIDFLRKPGMHSVTLSSAFDNGDRYSLKVPRWAQLPLADALEGAMQRLMEELDGQVLFFRPRSARR